MFECRCSLLPTDKLLQLFPTTSHIMSCILSREAHPPQIYKERCLNSNCNLSDPAASKCRSTSVPRWSRVWACVYVGGVHLISCYHPEIYQWPLLLVLWQNSGLHQSFKRIKTRVRPFLQMVRTSTRARLLHLSRWRQLQRSRRSRSAIIFQL